MGMRSRVTENQDLYVTVGNISLLFGNFPSPITTGNAIGISFLPLLLLICRGGWNFRAEVIFAGHSAGGLQLRYDRHFRHP